MVAVRRVVANPEYPLAALIELVRRPEDFEELLALRAITDSVAADALDAISLVSPADRYVGRRTPVVMAPFLDPWPSRFSAGTYGVLYTADSLEVAVREHGYHAGRILASARVTTPTTLPRYGLELTLDDRDHCDIRKGGSDDVKDARIYDPQSYAASQKLGAELRSAGHQGVWYDSVRAPGGSCYGTFRPVAVIDVANEATELELVWNGSAMAEYRTITSHRLT